MTRFQCTRWWRGCAAALSGLTVIALAASIDEASAAAAVSATIKKGVLTVTGTTASDAITLRLRAGDPNTVEVDAGANGTADFAFDRQRFQTITVNGRAGGDTIVVDQSNGAFTDTESTTLDGGDGNDTLRGGFGTETLLGGAGADYLDADQGADTVDAGGGNDVIAWNPGGASDTINGGTGNDRLAFNGSAANESIDLAAVNGHVRLTRDVAAVVLDVAGLEAIDLRALGGTDTLTVHDLSGTGLSEVHTDLAAFDGSDDGQPDTVAVPSGVTVSQDAAAAVVDGLGARISVVNGGIGDVVDISGTGTTDTVTVAATDGADTVTAYADGTDVGVAGAAAGMALRLSGVELLNADLAGGDDRFTAIGDLADLTTLKVTGGAGDDTLLGGNGADALAGGAGADFLDGNQGNDTIDAGDGNDAVAWDPGGASDTISGGTGSDRLAFNGSAVGENVGLTAATGHVRLTRDVGAVGLDLTGLENVDLRTLGGTDRVAVNDLSGTELTSVSVDLAGSGATTGDGAVDEVIVYGTAADDTIDVSADGLAVVAGGLFTGVRVTDADPNLDYLTVNGLAGDDAITSSPAAALILLNLLP